MQFLMTMSKVFWRLQPWVHLNSDKCDKLECENEVRTKAELDDAPSQMGGTLDRTEKEIVRQPKDGAKSEDDASRLDKKVNCVTEKEKHQGPDDPAVLEKLHDRVDNVLKNAEKGKFFECSTRRKFHVIIKSEPEQTARFKERDENVRKAENETGREWHRQFHTNVSGI